MGQYVHCHGEGIAVFRVAGLRRSGGAKVALLAHLEGGAHGWEHERRLYKAPHPVVKCHWCGGWLLVRYMKLWDGRWQCKSWPACSRRSFAHGGPRATQGGRDYEL